MLKDIVVNLSGRAPQDFAADYAISMAATFGAHVTGIAFVYEPVIPDGTLGGVPDRPDRDAARGKQQGRRGRGQPVRGRRRRRPGFRPRPASLDATFGGAATLFGRIARRFDISTSSARRSASTARPRN